jgi:hypothetical protein
MALTLTSVGRQRPPRTAWKPGQSGNPRGAPKRGYDGPTLSELCRAETPEAVKTLITMMKFKGPNQLPATLAILDRGWGRPAQHIETTGDSHITLHLLAAQAVQALDAPQQHDEQPRQPLTIDGSLPTE